MSFVRSKVFIVLVITNVITLSAVLVLIGFMLGQQSAIQTRQNEVNSAAPIPPTALDTASDQQRPLRKKQLSQLEESHLKQSDETVFLQQLTETEIDKPDAVDVYYDGGFVRMEEVDEFGKKLVSISNTMYDVEKLAKGDREYLAALDELKSGSRTHMTITKPMDAKKTIATTTTDIGDQNVNYFNKASVNSDLTEASENSSITRQIEAIVASEEDVEEPQSEYENAPQLKPVDQKSGEADSLDYVQALNQEYLERANEMRVIRVQAGDSLWKIAEKAYGDGFRYKRIFKANPQLTSPNKLKVGDLIRVPL